MDFLREESFDVTINLSITKIPRKSRKFSESKMFKLRPYIQEDMEGK